MKPPAMEPEIAAAKLEARMATTYTFGGWPQQVTCGTPELATLTCEHIARAKAVRRVAYEQLLKELHLTSAIIDGECVEIPQYRLLLT